MEKITGLALRIIALLDESGATDEERYTALIVAQDLQSFQSSENESARRKEKGN